MYSKIAGDFTDTCGNCGHGFFAVSGRSFHIEVPAFAGWNHTETACGQGKA
jgi:hypothetical protein